MLLDAQRVLALLNEFFDRLSCAKYGCLSIHGDNWHYSFELNRDDLEQQKAMIASMRDAQAKEVKLVEDALKSELLKRHLKGAP
jgi:hypothetical protein